MPTFQAKKFRYVLKVIIKNVIFLCTAVLEISLIFNFLFFKQCFERVVMINFEFYLILEGLNSIFNYSFPCFNKLLLYYRKALRKKKNPLKLKTDRNFVVLFTLLMRFPFSRLLKLTPNPVD